jgi:hypothetical protein
VDARANRRSAAALGGAAHAIKGACALASPQSARQ